MCQSGPVASIIVTSRHNRDIAKAFITLFGLHNAYDGYRDIRLGGRSVDAIVLKFKLHFLFEYIVFCFVLIGMHIT